MITAAASISRSIQGRTRSPRQEAKRSIIGYYDTPTTPHVARPSPKLID